MEQQARDERNKRLRINIIFLVVAIILSFYFVQLRFTTNIRMTHSSALELAQGVAWTPYQYRALIPWFVSFLVRLPFVRPDAILGLYRLTEFIFLLALVISFRYYLSFFFRSLLVSSVLAFSLFYVLPFNYLVTYWFPYDIPSVLFFTLALILLYKRKWIWYYPLFAIGTLNRETTIFLVFIYVVTSFGNISTRKIAWHSGAQLVIWVVVKLFLLLLYAENTGEGFFNWKIMENVNQLMKPYAIFLLSVNLGMLWIPALAGYRWIQDRFVRRSLLVVFPFFIVMFILGEIFELRIYGELIPIILPAALLVFQALFRAESEGGSLT